MHYLVVSPTPLFPTTAGNRSLILAMIRQIRAAGHRVSLLYSAQEDGADTDMTATSAEVDALYLHSYDLARRHAEMSRALVRASLERVPVNFDLDSWYPWDIDDLIQQIYVHDPFEVMLGNYIWMSRAFVAAPESVIKIQQTHDSMSNRMLRLAQQGMPPSFFSVTPEDEGRGLDRADINIALQDGEEIFFRTLTDKIVRTLQHAPADIPFAPRPLPQGRKMRVGFIGSDNAVNVKTATALVDALARHPAVTDKIDLCVAGHICKIFPHPPSFMHLLGADRALADIYGAMDVMINPVADGTGLKIKSVEALQYHVPIIMTQAASEGLMSPYPFHRCASVDETLSYLTMIAENPALLGGMQIAGRKVLHAYRDRLAKGADALIVPQKVIDEQAWRTARKREIVWQDKVLTFYESPTPPTALSLPLKLSVENLVAIVPPRSVWLDIGSRCGEWAILAATAFQAGKVIAVEYDPDYVEQLKLNVIRNRLQDVIDMRMLGYAPGASPGYGTVEPGQNRSVAIFDQSADLSAQATTPFAPIEQFFDKDQEIDVININMPDPVQMLAALQGVIAEHHPFLLVHRLHDVLTAVTEWARQHNYILQEELQDKLAVYVLVFTPLSRE